MRKSLWWDTGGVRCSTHGLCLPGQTLTVRMMLMFSNLSLFSPCFISLAHRIWSFQRLISNNSYKFSLLSDLPASKCSFLDAPGIHCLNFNSFSWEVVAFYSEKGLKISFALPHLKEFRVFLDLFSRMGTSDPEIYREGWSSRWLGQWS